MFILFFSVVVSLNSSTKQHEMMIDCMRNSSNLMYLICSKNMRAILILFSCKFSKFSVLYQIFCYFLFYFVYLFMNFFLPFLFILWKFYVFFVLVFGDEKGIIYIHKWFSQAFLSSLVSFLFSLNCLCFFPFFNSIRNKSYNNNKNIQQQAAAVQNKEA
jgi:hypothetical protein